MAIRRIYCGYTGSSTSRSATTINRSPGSQSKKPHSFPMVSSDTMPCALEPIRDRVLMDKLVALASEQIKEAKTIAKMQREHQMKQDRMTKMMLACLKKTSGV